MVQESIALDADGKRDPQRDDWLIEDVGYLPESVVPEFVAARYAKAVRVVRVVDNAPRWRSETAFDFLTV